MEIQRLRKSVGCEVLSDDPALDYYSVDSSFFQIRPKAVVVPRTIRDIVNTIRFARNNGISVTARGGGTGLVGSALNNGIILDLQNFNKIKVYQNHVVVGAGVHKGMLDEILGKHNKFLGPNPSVGPYCTIGGMIGTNASGSRSLKYGSTIENLLAVTMITSGGRVIDLPSNTKLARSIHRIACLVDKSAYPRTSKNSCGYRLDAVRTMSDTHKVIAASEGTLGIVVSAKLRIYDIPKKRTLVILGYGSPVKAATDCQKIVRLEPSALEFVDRSTMRNIAAKFPQNIRCLLYVEFDSDVTEKILLLGRMSSGKILHKLSDRKSIAKWWAFRNSALYFSLKNVLSSRALPHIIEDAAVPLDKLDKLMEFAEGIRKKFAVKLVMYGHAGNGNMHIRMASKNKSKTLSDRIASDFFSQVIAVNGTITGEHGDGLARSKFVRRQYGKNTYKLFSKLKSELDPTNTLNPNKILV